MLVDVCELTNTENNAQRINDKDVLLLKSVIIFRYKEDEKKPAEEYENSKKPWKNSRKE